MEALHNRVVGEKPWLVSANIGRTIGIPDDAVEEGGFWYWIEGEAPYLHIMCAGAGFGPYEIQDHNAWYPDEIHAHRERLLTHAKREEL